MGILFAGFASEFSHNERIFRDYRGCSGIPFFVPYIEIINIYILYFSIIIERRYVKCPSQINKKQVVVIIVKYSSLLCLGTFLSPLRHCFDSAGIVTLSKGENLSQRKSESLVEYLGRFRHTGEKLSLCNFGAVVCDSYFPGAGGCCSAGSLPSPPPPSFSV